MLDTQAQRSKFQFPEPTSKINNKASASCNPHAEKTEAGRSLGLALVSERHVSKNKMAVDKRAEHVKPCQPVACAEVAYYANMQKPKAMVPATL